MPTLRNDVTGATEPAMVGTSRHHHGVVGESKEGGAGLVGVSAKGEGVSAFSASGPGVVGQSDEKPGVRGLSKPGPGVEGVSARGAGVRGASDSGAGVEGESMSGHGVTGLSQGGSGLRGVSIAGRGVEGWSESAYGVSGDSTSSAGVRGTSQTGRGVEGWSTRSEGVVGISDSGTGVWGVAGRGRFRGADTVDQIGVLFRSGLAARDWVEASQHGVPRPEPDPQEHAEAHALESPIAGGAIGDRIGIDTSVDIAALAFDDAAGVGVCGEHRGAGIGVKATSRAGMGVLAYSQEHEAVHAESRSPVTAAIAAYNANPHGTGAAVYARKVGPNGHAGFFDGRVWITGELGVGGDIVLANADCAEDFDVADASVAEPGTVLAIGDDGVLAPSARPYDKCVIGVVSGAGDYRPALVLDKQHTTRDRSPVALIGKVFCKVSAAFGAIEPGDLLTTSPLPGRAMKASDPARAFGAVIGKALRPLREGEGMIPIVIALQ